MTDLKNARRIRAALPNGTPVIPHSFEAEAGLLGCIFQEPGCFKNFHTRSSEIFYDVRNATIFDAAKALYQRRMVIDLVTLTEYLRTEKILKNCGGPAYLMTLPEAAPSALNWPYYLEILLEKFALRKSIDICRSGIMRVASYEGSVDGFVQGLLADLDNVSRVANVKGSDQPALKIWKADDLAQYVPPSDLELVGDNEIFRGYEGICVFAGPGSSGKSLAVSALALAGAIGGGTWMGRKVHRKFNTLILQAENGKRRLKNFILRMKELHPDVDINSHIFFSEPPEGGLPFDSSEFRAAVREAIAFHKIDLVILDPWSHVGCEDSADAIKEKLTQIRSCFPSGDDCPCLLIVAHTVKPRADNVRKGRGLMYMVTGSINLCNTSRCTYVMLPWTEDIEDKRVYFATPKLNDGENYSPTVWIRQFGTFFEHDSQTDPRDFGKTDDEREKISREHLETCFDKVAELKASDVVKKLSKISGAGESTCYRAIGEDGYLRPLLIRSGTGKLKLREPVE